MYTYRKLVYGAVMAHVAWMGIDPWPMGMGVVSAAKRALERAELKIGDLDLVEANEAFAAQLVEVRRE